MKVHFVKFFSLTFLVVCIFASCGKADKETFDFFGAKSTIEISDYAQYNGYSEDGIIEYFKESKANLIVEDNYMKISSDSFSVDFELKKNHTLSDKNYIVYDVIPETDYSDVIFSNDIFIRYNRNENARIAWGIFIYYSIPDSPNDYDIKVVYNYAL